MNGSVYDLRSGVKGKAVTVTSLTLPPTSLHAVKTRLLKPLKGAFYVVIGGGGGVF